ncbi:glycogen debranching protein GlgX [Granulosicoccaceae sp. 1_MG-2023]|nr:glycogen debranching protein GlgX [Granulosicoccaceae sp. 1_MG-2023]
MTRHAIEAGDPYPLGATWDGSGVNFALFSAHAERVELCLFDASGRRELARHDLPGNTNQVWHGYLPYAGPGTLYGYRVHGPYDPTRGHRFNPHKLLLDPYARQHHGAIRWSDTVNGYRAGNKSEDLSFCKRDSASAMPKCVVTDPASTWGQDTPPSIPWAETVIYETHVRGMTRLHPKVTKSHRGTYTGLADPHMIEYLKALGVTTVELLPVQAFVNDRFLVERKLKNYWGYSTLGYFTPHGQYAHSNAIQDFKTMVRRFHDANLEVVLDVVYNHTAEGNHLGPHLSWRGIDNASYYRLNPQERRYYINDTGCGNTLNLNHPRVLQMVMDSLRYWVKEMHVDGFRFDLASTLGREEKGFDGKASFFNAVLQDPVLSRVKLIAEPWDLGPGGYQLGQFPLGWAEWNDRFRDTTRKYWLGQPGLLPELAKSVHGSGDVFEHHDRQPWASVNFITSHDGFTLRDLVSYEHKHNEANGEENRDGHGANYSANFGVEGETDDPAINAHRWQRMRNMMATLLFSQGTPMILAGDEFGHSKQGNNNAYCQDNEINWLDWKFSDDQQAMQRFVSRLLQLRKQFPVLRRDCFVHGTPVLPDSPILDIDWIGAHGGTLHESEWRELTKRCMGVVLSDAADGRVRSLLIIFNASDNAVDFTLPARQNAQWELLLDTAQPDISGGVYHPGESVVPVAAQSVTALQVEM